MIVSGFMIPAAKVATCVPTDTAKTALDSMVKLKIGAIIVVSPNNAKQAVGILTKTDFVEAYQQGLSLDTPVSMLMSDTLQTLRDTTSRDAAASFFESNRQTIMPSLSMTRATLSVSFRHGMSAPNVPRMERRGRGIEVRTEAFTSPLASQGSRPRFSHIGASGIAHVSRLH